MEKYKYFNLNSYYLNKIYKIRSILSRKTNRLRSLLISREIEL